MLNKNDGFIKGVLMIKRLCNEDYVTSQWSGGTTTQIAIYPENEKYVDRNFLWRLSSATIDVEESDFTELVDYNRFIATLDKGIELHQEGEVYKLDPLALHYFDGGVATKSFGSCRDFNLMIRKDKCSATVELIDESTKLMYSSDGCKQFILFCVSGGSKVTFEKSVVSIQEFETIIIENQKAYLVFDSMINTKIYVIEIF